MKARSPHYIFPLGETAVSILSFISAGLGGTDLTVSISASKRGITMRLGGRVVVRNAPLDELNARYKQGVAKLRAECAADLRRTPA